MRSQDQDVVILHSRKFTDSKSIYTVFSKHNGVLNLVYRPNKKQVRLTPFTPYDVSWLGRGDLKTIAHIEPSATAILTAGRALYCGMYVNEICIRALPVGENNPEVYTWYIETIKKLSLANDDSKLFEVILRRFEFSLLTALGFGIHFDLCHQHNKISASPSSYYQYKVGLGFCRQYGEVDMNSDSVFAGQALMDIANECWNDLALQSAKRLSRLVLPSVVGTRPIKSRELFS